MNHFKAGFLQEIARTAAGNFAWSEGIAAEALEAQTFPSRSGRRWLRGWSTTPYTGRMGIGARYCGATRTDL